MAHGSPADGSRYIGVCIPEDYVHELVHVGLQCVLSRGSGGGCTGVRLIDFQPPYGGSVHKGFTGYRCCNDLLIPRCEKVCANGGCCVLSADVLGSVQS